MEKAFTDITVRTLNPDSLDRVLQNLTGILAMVIKNSYNGDTCQVRILSGDVGFAKYAITTQGYGDIVES